MTCIYYLSGNISAKSLGPHQFFELLVVVQH